MRAKRYWPLAAVALIALLRIRSDLALVLGLLLAYSAHLSRTGIDPEPLKRWQAYLLQLCVVGLGFGISLQTVLSIGREQFWVTFVSISATLVLGVGLGRLFGLSAKGGYLVAAGTAICGGSAIAALTPILKPKSDELALSLAVVFFLNSVALLLFPAIGHALSLSQGEFGLWSALAIHDTSSVVGAAQHFGHEALVTATTVKLMRALWILPLSLATAAVMTAWAAGKGESRAARPAFPWFILGFIGATLLTTLFADQHPAPFQEISALARRGFAGVLFLIGLQIPLKNLRGLGTRTLSAALGLWLIVSFASLWYAQRYASHI